MSFFVIILVLGLVSGLAYLIYKVIANFLSKVGSVDPDNSVEASNVLRNTRIYSAILSAVTLIAVSVVPMTLKFQIPFFPMQIMVFSSIYYEPSNIPASISALYFLMPLVMLTANFVAQPRTMKLLSVLMFVPLITVFLSVPMIDTTGHNWGDLRLIGIGTLIYFGIAVAQTILWSVCIRKSQWTLRESAEI